MRVVIGRERHCRRPRGRSTVRAWGLRSLLRLRACYGSLGRPCAPHARSIEGRSGVRSAARTSVRGLRRKEPDVQRANRSRVPPDDTSVVRAQHRGDERGERCHCSLHQSVKRERRASEREQRHRDADQDGERQDVPARESNGLGRARRRKTIKGVRMHRGRRFLSTQSRAALGLHLPLRGDVVPQASELGRLTGDSRYRVSPVQPRSAFQDERSCRRSPPASGRGTPSMILAGSQR